MKRSLWLMIICGLFFITGCTFNSTYINEEGERIKAEKVTDSLYNYIRDRKFAGAQELFSQQFFDVTGKDGYERSLRKHIRAWEVIDQEN